MGKRQQPKMHWSAYLWPGFPHIWNRGSWAGLALAVGFTVLLNVLMVATLVWTEWMSPGARQIGLGLLVAIWTVAWLESRADWRRILAEWRAGESAGLETVPAGSLGAGENQEPEEQSDRLFHDAQQQYLAGNWGRCEQLLRHLLKLDKRDVEARLLLATLWRHLGRTEEAARQLHRLEQLEAAASWSYEIACELDEIGFQNNRRAEDGKIQTMTNRPMTNRPMKNRDVTDRDVTDRDVTDRDVTDRDVTDRDVTTSVTMEDPPAQVEQLQQAQVEQLQQAQVEQLQQAQVEQLQQTGDQSSRAA